MGGNNENINLTSLTAREHFIAHICLTKMCIYQKDLKKMIFAVDMMGCISTTQKRYINSYLYEANMKESIKLRSGKNHWSYEANLPYFNGKHQPKVKQNEPKPKSKLASRQHFGNDNPFYHKNHSEKQKNLWSKHRRGANAAVISSIAIYDNNDNIQYKFYGYLLEDICKLFDLPMRSIITSYQNSGRKLYQHVQPHKPNKRWVRYKNWYAIKEKI